MRTTKPLRQGELRKVQEPPPTRCAARSDALSYPPILPKKQPGRTRPGCLRGTLLDNTEPINVAEGLPPVEFMKLSQRTARSSFPPSALALVFSPREEVEIYAAEQREESPTMREEAAKH